MKTIKIKDFSIEVTDDILEDYYKDLSDEQIINRIVDDVQNQTGLFMCFQDYEVEND